MKIGLFYGSTTCYTEMVAEKIQAIIGDELLEMNNIKDIPLAKATEYDLLIFGISTWDFGELQEDWEAKWDDIRDLNLTGKVCAIYGMGDQIGYTEWFQDAMGMLHDELKAIGAKLVGEWPNSGYEFTASKALNESKTHFVGLALDDENQYDLTDARLAEWLTQVLEAFSDEA